MIVIVHIIYSNYIQNKIFKHCSYTELLKYTECIDNLQ